MQSGKECRTLCTFRIAWMGLKNARRGQVASSTGHLDGGVTHTRLWLCFPWSYIDICRLGYRYRVKRGNGFHIYVYMVLVCVCVYFSKKKCMLGWPESSFGIFCKMLCKNQNKLSGQCNTYVSIYTYILQQLYFLRKKSEAVNNKQLYCHNWFS